MVNQDGRNFPFLILCVLITVEEKAVEKKPLQLQRLTFGAPQLLQDVVMRSGMGTMAVGGFLYFG